MKKFKFIFTTAMMILFVSNIAKSTEECFERTSRAIFKFNMAVDDVVLEPIAKGYNKLPSPIKLGTSNFTSNIGTLLSIPNNILQGNFKQLGHSIGSFAINSTVGVLGLLNPAEKIGLNPNKEDVGQTLGSYGIGPGCYFVLPILGPTTMRDSIGMVADTFIDPFAHVTIREKELLSISGNSLDYYSVKASGAIDFRADNEKNFESLEKNSIDLYSSLKSIYLQDRENKISNSIEDEKDEWGNLDN
jgi:phospholipid-binding lipoprotein MlaA